MRTELLGVAELIWDARGQNGRRGDDGAAGPFGYGRDGGSGSSGNRGADGTAGGRIRAVVQIDLDGVAYVQGSLNEQERVDRFKVQTGESLFLTVRGGDGGHGGNGGRGQNGKTGSPGRDATRYSSGGDGGPGGDGGNGGGAGSGGNAGDGGALELIVPPESLDLLLAVRWDVSPGDKGLPGAPGEGGAGGAGGPGGSSYSWTETETYTDSQGQTQTRTKYRSNPGGSSGISGSPGRRGATGSSGKAAQPGNFALKIDGQSYPDRYRFHCPDYDIVAGGGNDIFEFGQTDNRLVGVRVENRGPAPSPGRTVAAYLQASRGQTPHGEHQVLRTVPTAHQVVLEPLLFDLAEVDDAALPTIHSRYKEKVVVEPKLRFSRLDRDDPEYSRPREIEVTFPVELETLVATTSLAPGVESVQRWRIHNLGSTPFPPPGRRVFLDLKTESAGATLRVFRESGEEFEIDGEPRLYEEIRSISPGESVPVSATICAPIDSTPYSKVVLAADLRLTPCGGGEARAIQRNPTEYNIALVQEPKDSEVCLVTHHGCSANEVKGWLDLFSKLDMSYSVWDVSYHGHWPVERLAEFVKGKLTVVLETEFEAPDRSKTRPSELLHLSSFRQSIGLLGVSYYFLGGKGKLLEFMVPQPTEARNFHSLADYLKEVSQQKRLNPEVPLEFERTLDRISISKFFVAGEPRLDYLHEKALELINELYRRYPQRQYLVTTVFDPYSVEGGWLKRKDCGVLEVRKLPDRDARAVVVRQVQRTNGVRPEFLFSGENLLGLFSAQDFDDKLDSLRKVGRSSETPWTEAQEALADAILLDFLEEQLAMRRSSARFSKKALASALNRTTEFCATDFRQGEATVGVDTVLAGVLLRVVAGLKFLTTGQITQWDHRIRFLGGTGDVEINIYIEKQLDSFLDRNFGPDRLLATGENRKRAEERIKEREAILSQQRELIGLQSKSHKKLSSKETTAEALVRWELRDFLESGVEAGSLIWTREQMEEHQSFEAEHERKRDGLLELYRRALEAVTPSG